MKRWKMTEDSRCPNCGQHSEDAAHLNICRSTERKQLLLRSINDLEAWMDDHCTHLDIAEYIPLYLVYHGERKMDSLLGMSQAFRPIAEEQNSIGWRNFKLHRREDRRKNVITPGDASTRQ